MPSPPQLKLPPTKSNDVELPRSLQELNALGCNLRKVTLKRSHRLVAGNLVAFVTRPRVWSFLVDIDRTATGGLE